MAYQTVNPYDNQVVATFDDLTDEQAMDVLAQAQKTFESWSQTSFAERTAVISRAAAILRERADEFARLLTLEMGKLYSEALGEVELSAQILDYYAVNAEKFLAPEPLDTGSDDNAMLVSAPLGVILGVQPWNFPYYQLARVAGPNLMAGNVVMVKHASNVPQAAAAFEKLLLDAGAPAGAYANLYATKEQINLLIDDPRVRGVALTGSEGAGAVVRAGGQERQEVHPGTGRVGCIHRAGWTSGPASSPRRTDRRPSARTLPPETSPGTRRQSRRRRRCAWRPHSTGRR